MTESSGPQGFTPPPYPYDRLTAVTTAAKERFATSGGIVDCSIGTPCDPPPEFVVEALATSGSERGYPTSLGSVAYREAAGGWLLRRFGVHLNPGSEIAACVGTKEFVASAAQYLKLRTPTRDTVLYPSISYPTYAMGAALAGCRAVEVPELPDGGLDLDAIADDDRRRALVLWINSPSNPTGRLSDLDAAASWGRAAGVPVFSDECYAEFTWDGPPATVLSSGVSGVVAVHSLSKRSNLAGVRAGFYAGDPELIHYLSEVRKHAGLMMPGPVQAAGAAAYDDDVHVELQRDRYRGRLALMHDVLTEAGFPGPLPQGAFYLWVPVPERFAGDSWAAAEHLALEGGLLVGPGDLYGPRGQGHVRVAVVQPDERIALVGDRLRAARR